MGNMSLASDFAFLIHDALCFNSCISGWVRDRQATTGLDSPCAIAVACQRLRAPSDAGGSQPDLDCDSSSAMANADEHPLWGCDVLAPRLRCTRVHVRHWNVAGEPRSYNRTPCWDVGDSKRSSWETKQTRQSQFASGQAAPPGESAVFRRVVRLQG